MVRRSEPQDYPKSKKSRHKIDPSREHRNRPLAKRLPEGTLTGIDAIAKFHRISFQHAVWCSLVKVGVHPKEAYRFCRPSITGKDTARQGGHRWMKKLAGVIRSMEVDAAMMGLADAAMVRAVIHPEPEIALKGADQINKRFGRYKAEAVQVNVLGGMISLAESLAGTESISGRTVPKLETRSREVEAEDGSGSDLAGTGDPVPPVSPGVRPGGEPSGSGDPAPSGGAGGAEGGEQRAEE